LICARLQTVQIESLDWRKSLPKYDTPETLHYLDPPYLHSTRKSGGYRYELSVQDHEELVETILDLQGMTLLSGYKNSIYERLERNGWLRYDFETPCHAAGPNTSRVGDRKESRPRRVESVWLSPSLQEVLDRRADAVTFM
jgi:DNA adenine methylase